MHYCLYPRHRPVTKKSEQFGVGEGWPVLEAQDHRPPAHSDLVAASQGSRWATEGFEHRLVELADAGKPGGKGDGRQGEIGLIDEQTSRLCPTRPGQSQGTSTHLPEQFPVQMTRTYRQSARQPTHPLGVHRSLGDQPQGASNQIHLATPICRTGACLRTTAPTGPKPGGLGCCRARVEAHIGGVGRAGRTDRSAVDTRRSHRRKESPIKARIAATDSPIAKLEVVMQLGFHGFKLIQPQGIALAVFGRGGQSIASIEQVRTTSMETAR